MILDKMRGGKTERNAVVTRRTFAAIEGDLKRAVTRRRLHPDPVSRRGNDRAVDALLDELLETFPGLRSTRKVV